MSDISDNIGTKLRQLRRNSGETQEEVARAVGVTWRHYQRWEKGQVTPYWQNIEALSEHFKVEPGVLVGTIDDGTKTEPVEIRMAQLKRTVMELETRVYSMAKEIAKLRDEDEKQQ